MQFDFKQQKKRFGQNFLNNPFIVNEIINFINPQPNQALVEIGPGTGALTFALEKHLTHLNIIEIDHDLIKFWQNYNSKKINLYAGDALKFNFNIFLSNIRVVGNLPYNISTPLLFHLSNYDSIIDMHFMLQQEVVERICASPNCKAYGKLSIMLQCSYDCYKLLAVSADNFTPQPQVNSAVIRMIPKEKASCDLNKLKIIVNLAFNKRRKTIQNSLKSLFSANQLIDYQIDPSLRAENITVKEYIYLANRLYT